MKFYFDYCKKRHNTFYGNCLKFHFSKLKDNEKTSLTKKLIISGQITATFFGKKVLYSKRMQNGVKAVMSYGGAQKMNLFYYRGCVNHNFKVRPCK